MVKKLIKYDFKSYLRILLPVQLIVIGIAAINRFIQIFEPPTVPGTNTLAFFGMYSESGSSPVYDGIFTSSIILYYISIAVCLIITIIVAIVRFYQGMYSNEGYLNHTLPVTPAQHITAKLLTSMIFSVGSAFAIFLSFMVITAGDLNIEIFKAAFYLFGKQYRNIGFNAVLLIFEFIVMLIASFFAMYLKFYCCLSIGQLANKRKILVAFAAFFGIYILKQICGTVIIIYAAVNSDIMNELGAWIEANTTSFFHILFCSGIAFYILIGAIYFLVGKHLMSKKLNLA